MPRKKGLQLCSVSPWLLKFIMVSLLFTACWGGESSETESVFKFIKAIDPGNVTKIRWSSLVYEFCLYNVKVVKCNLESGSITKIRLEHLNLSGIIDANSLCSLPNLQYVNLANNLIHGVIPESIANCKSLTTLNLRNNLLGGTIPSSLRKLKNLRKLDISNNRITQRKKPLRYKNVMCNNSLEPDAEWSSSSKSMVKWRKLSSAESPGQNGSGAEKQNQWITWMPLVLGIGFFILLTYIVGQRAAKLAREREFLRALCESPVNTVPAKPRDEIKQQESCEELVFFVEEHEAFKLDDLFEAAADLQGQSHCSSLYKVTLRNNVTYAVKRLKKLQVPCDEFCQTMTKIGNMKHPNILPLVGYNSSKEEKLLIYKYKSNGSLRNLFENYIEDKRDFPWRLRLFIAAGIAKGLDFIHQRSSGDEYLPHGNLKLSNILLDDNMEPLISEYGYAKFMNLQGASLYAADGYMAPENSLSEPADVYSFGVILLELLTGKMIEKTGIDLPKWVKAMVREEWTGEVLDKEVSRGAKQWAFPLLNISLLCVSDVPENRPSIAEVLEKIEEVITVQQGDPLSPVLPVESIHQDRCLLHSVIPETWDTPGSDK